MPRVYCHGNSMTVLCPVIDDLVPVSKCYNCMRYLFRNFNYVVCGEELVRRFGNKHEVLRKDPIMVRDSEGRVWVYELQGSAVTSMGVWKVISDEKKAEPE